MLLMKQKIMCLVFRVLLESRRPGNLAWDFFFLVGGGGGGLIFGPGIFVGFVGNLTEFFAFWFLPPFDRDRDHPRQLKSIVPPLGPPYHKSNGACKKMYDVKVTKHNPLTNVNSNSNDAVQDIVLILHYIST